MSLFKYICLYLVIGLLLITCDKWEETADMSHISYLPEFNFEGGEFISIVKNDTGEFEDPGMIARVQGKIVQWYYLNEPDVDITTPGLYIIYYYAENSEGFSSIAERVVVVTYEDVTNNDLSGTYTGTLWQPLVESRVTKIDEKGLYKCEEILGFPGASMPGRFADLGENRLVLLPGEGYFGKYNVSEGDYSQRILSWSVILLDPPYRGLEIPVLWRKTE
jgi:hypothetical protein